MTDWQKFVLPDPSKAWREAGKVAKPIVDPIIGAKARIAKGITDTIAIIKEGVENPTRGWYKMKGDVAKATVRVGNKILPIGDALFQAVPRDKAHQYYEAILKSLHSGHFDDEIRKLITGKASETIGAPKRADAGKSRGKLSPEALAERRAKMAAKGTAKKK